MSFLNIPVFNFIKNKDVFVSDYFSVTGQEILLEHFSSSYNFYTKISNSPAITGKQIKLTPRDVGSLQIEYTATNAFSEILPQNIKIFSEWENFDETNARFVFEKTLSLPYSSDEIFIKPNEWGTAEIFNNSISKLYHNLEYLKLNTRILNSKAPSFYYGWFGVNIYNTSIGPRWYIKNYGERDSLFPNRVLKKQPGFLNIVSFVVSKDYIIILDKKTELESNLEKDKFSFRFFLNDGSSKEILLDDSLLPLEDLFVNPISIVFDDKNKNLFVLDSIQNKLQKIKLNINSKISYNIDNYIQGFGFEFDSNSFNIPIESNLVKENVFVLDYGNQCIKHFSTDLFWLGTYKFPTENKIKLFSVHPTLLLFLLSENGYIYVMNPSSHQVEYEFNINPYIQNPDLVSKIVLDEAGEFLYIVLPSEIYKFTSSGFFITKLNLPEMETLSFSQAFVGKNKNLFFSTNHNILKVQDFVETVKIGETYNKFYWPLNQLLISSKEFATDITYNRSLQRLIQNIKNFRDSIDHNIVEIQENLKEGIITYLTLAPINNDVPIRLHPRLEENLLKIAVNDFHVPQIFNSLLAPILESLQILAENLGIKPFEQYTLTSGSSSKNIYTPCSEFCWSWKAMTFLSSGAPVFKICDYNPISWQELKTNIATDPKNWSSAVSPCCE